MKLLILCAWLFLAPEIQSLEIIAGDFSDVAPIGTTGSDEIVDGPPININRYERRHKRSDDSSKEEDEDHLDEHIAIHSYKVKSIITSRFAETVFSTKIVNKDLRPQDVTFNVEIPKGAYISNFTMTVNGNTFVGSVHERSVARNLYAQARAQGKAAGILRTSAHEMESFKAEVNVPGGSKASFELYCQELLQRRLGFYEQTIILRPGNLVKQLQVDVYIFEPQGISRIEAPNMFGAQFDGLIRMTKGENKAHVSFKPTVDQQRKCPNCTDSAIDGSFIVRYDVKQELNGGSIQVSNGYFAHFFAPNNLPPLPKNIIFVIDVSGSMWGIKMKQTVEAMATILSDLRPEDHFTIIDFNHNIRFWNDKLVAATPIFVEDAKKYIEKIQPNGGTNINEAILSAIYILTESNKLGLLDPRSVSFIIMVSDGDPTVGEIKLSNIQRNVRRQMQEDFSLFCLGIGFDVDYDFLERMALENQGFARRIIANVNASSQLKDFYEEVAIPLLRKIDIHYSDDVTDVTQNSFDKYFSGSEIIVAGKLVDTKPSSFQCLVTASSAKDDLMFQIDTPTDELDKILAMQKYVLPDFAKQLWAYLMIKQLLSERVLAQSALQKRNITSRILAIALVHQFVTPVTAMLVESEETGQRLLADSPKSTRNGCCTGTPVIGKKTSAIPTWAKHSYSTPQPPQQLIRPEVDSKLGLKIPVTSVENDPHFIIHLPKSKQDICFNINPQPGKILNLVSDPIKGIVINGKIIGGKEAKNGKLNTYFGIIGLHFTKLNLSFEINTEKIRLKDGQHKTLLWWSESSTLTHAGVVVSVQKNTNVTITVGEDMAFLILLHRVWKNHPTNVDFLGFYAPPSNNFSTSVHGLIGQFIHEPEVNVYNIRQGSDPDKPQATMEVKGHQITVTRGLQKDYRTDTVNGTDVQCWFIHNSGKGFIDGHFKDYLVPHLYSFLNHPQAF
ncbi:inter-alpha-trypsin inhibitor heavy chain H2 isoform X2 [Stegostoma tigrinum]|uniref:inter-alpha-trypsin inhibitor heavy chain H2 isoform X2 n=1 Tax=Stegostoma tigrinum TaxID=3053191 RepID=UPI0028701401|nr:inter-alpha-trypsin inhibitor heavy chain H2 isoform X2 [Stegostoma tigrinum]